MDTQNEILRLEPPVLRNTLNTKTPFSGKTITLSQQDYIQLNWSANYWEGQHSRAIVREEVLKSEVARLEAKVRDLNQRLYGKKSEKKSSQKDGSKGNLPPKGKRGQKKGTKGHGRLLLDLPVIEEEIDIPDHQKHCPCCGLSVEDFPGTEDCEIVEIEVEAYKRRYKRKRAKPSCKCGILPNIITAPPPNRLIPKGKLGISVWVEILLDKYLYCRPTHRLLQVLSNYDLHLSQGTVTGGLQKLEPLFAPLLEAISNHILSEKYWNTDETGWKVFEKIEGKVGYRWYLWVMRSPSAVVYLLDPSRSSQVPKDFFGEEAEGTIICDRFSAYKKLVKELKKLILAFCWAHVRRDFLDLGKSRPELDNWGMEWVDRIGLLYHLNNLRLEVIDQPKVFSECDKALRSQLDEMKTIRDNELKDKEMHEAQKKVLTSLVNHWSGLTLFVDDPQIPMDNNRGENALRTPVGGRKVYYGSGSQWSGHFAAMMFSILMTIKYSGINPLLWLTSYLEACANNGNKAPDILSNFLPWAMGADRLSELKATNPKITNTS